LAGLALTDEQFLDLMATENEEEGVSDFYADYVQDIQRIISVNAASEFQCIWDEAIASGKPRSTLTDEVGQTLIKLQDQLESSDLFDNESARKTVLSQALPKTLVKQFGLDTVLSRLPETYMRSLFASYLASRAFAFARSLERFSDLLVYRFHLQARHQSGLCRLLRLCLEPQRRHQGLMQDPTSSRKRHTNQEKC
jgi:NAD-specific glutamate dehydrogenase